MKTYSLLLLSVFIAGCKGQNKPQFMAAAPLIVSIDTYADNRDLPSLTLQLISALNGHYGNVLFQTADAGNNWQNLSLGLPENLQVSAVYSGSGELFLGAASGRLYHSSNPMSGQWEEEHVGCDAPMITGIFPGRSGPYVCLAEAGFYQKSSETDQWEPMHLTLEDKRIYAVLENPDGSILISCAGGIYKSRDKGKSWKHVFSAGWVNNLSASGPVLLGSGSKGLLRSGDGGEHWEYVLAGEGAVYRTKVLGNRLAAIRVAEPWRGLADNIPQRAYISGDEGKSWQAMEEGFLQNEAIYDLEQVGPYLFCTHKQGISRSSDGGKNWELVRSSGRNKAAGQLEIVPFRGQVFVVVKQDGC